MQAIPYTINRAKFNHSPYDLLNSNPQQKDKSKDITKSSRKKNRNKQNNQSQNALKMLRPTKICKKKQQVKFFNQNDSKLANMQTLNETKDKNPKLDEYQDSQQDQTSSRQYVQRIKSSYLVGQRKQQKDKFDQQPDIQTFEEQYEHLEEQPEGSRYEIFLRRKLAQTKQKYWPQLQQIQEVAADMITTSQRKPGQSSKKQFKQLKQKAIKSHRDPAKHNLKKQNQLQPVIGISQALHHKRSIQIEPKPKTCIKKAMYNTNKSFSNIPCNNIYTQMNTQHRKQDKIYYKKPTSLPRNSYKTKSQYNLNKKVKHLSSESEARKRQSTNSIEHINRNSEKRKYLSLSSKSKQLQRDRKYRDSSSKQRSGSKKSSNTQRNGQNDKIKIMAYQELENKAERNQKNIKMIWNCIGELWEQSRITHYVKNQNYSKMSEKNQNKIGQLCNKLQTQQQAMIELKIKTSQLIASEINKSGRV